MSVKLGTEVPFFRIGDLLLAASIITLAFLIAGGRGNSELERSAFVRGDGFEFEVQLDSDTTIFIEGRMGTLVLELENGRIRIAESPCRGQDCVRRRWISTPGDASICIPSVVLVRIDQAEDSSSRIDATTF